MSDRWLPGQHFHRRDDGDAAPAPGLVVNEWDALTLGVVVVGVVALSVFKQLVLPFLMDLL